MAQRITITIPDCLHDRLQVVKDRINVSGICQEALMHSVGIEEIKMHDIPEMEKLVARIQKEKQKYDAGWKQQAVEDGRNDANGISYLGFLSLENLYEGTCARIGGGESARSKSWSWFFEHEAGRASTRGLLPAFPVIGSHLSTYATNTDWNDEAYVQGWFEGAMSVWWQVKEKILLPQAEE